jgi:WD40 repeat protein/type II secretory pathway pseudopilin PulG
MDTGDRYDVFLSYHWRDHERVEALARWLRDQDLAVFLDRWYLVPGRPWPQALEQVLRACHAVAVCVGPGEMGPWQQREVNLALERQATDPSFPVIPVLLPDAKPVLGFLQQNTWVDLRHRPDDPGLLELLALAIRGEPPAAALQERVNATLAAICPYRGLLYFREEDAPFFCGRETAVEQVVTAVKRHRFLAVVGASGCGKSSVVRAGLIPALRRERDAVWEVVTLVPGDRPLHALAAALLPLLEPQMTETDRLAESNKLARYLAEGEIALRDIVQRALDKQPGTHRLLLVTDQWEELYTLTTDDAARRRFINELLEATATSPLSVVLTLRGDFVGRALGYRPLSDRLQGAQINLGPMTRAELERAIRSPAKKVGLSFEPGLVERILDDVGDEPGNLPLLEFVLSRLWEERRGACLLHDAYDAMGQLQGAVANKAEEVFGSLSVLEQQAVQRVFLQLVRLGEGVEGDTRRRATLEEIGVTSAQVVKRLADERLLVTAQGSPAQPEIVEVSHEALILNWGRLQNWLNEDRAFLLWRQRLRQSREEWEKGQHDEGALLRGTRLTEAEERLKDHPDDLSSAERAYIAASIALQEREAREREAQRQHELEAAQQLARARRQTIVELIAGLVIALVLAGGLAYQWQHAGEERDNARLAENNAKLAENREKTARTTAEQQKNLALARQLAAQATLALTSPPTDVVRGALLATESLYRAHTLEGYDAWATAMSLLPRGVVHLKHRDPVGKLAFSPDGARLAAAVTFGRTVFALTYGHTAAGRANLWDTATGQPLAAFDHAGGVVEATFSADGGLLATGSWDHTIAIADARTGQELRRLTREDAISALTFSPDGKRLAVGEKDGTLSVIDPLSGNDLVRVKHAGRIVALAFSADGGRLAAASEDKSVVVWDSTTGAETRRLTYKGSLLALAFSPAGPRLITSSNDDKKSWLLDVETGKIIVTLSDHEGQLVYDATFTADASRFVTRGGKNVGVWDASSGRLIWSRVNEQDLERAAVSPSGALVALVDKANILSVWDTTDGRERFHLTHEGISDIVFSADGQRIATAGGDEFVHLWDIPSGRELARLTHPGKLGKLVFSPDGRRLVATSQLSDDAYAWSELAMWRPEDWRQMGRLAAHPSGLWDISFNRTGKIVTTIRADKTVRLVNAETGSELASLAFEDDVESASLTSDDAHLLVTREYPPAPEVWDVGERRQLAALSDPGGGVDSIAFDSGHRLVATSGVDGTYRIWDADKGTELHRFKGGCCLSADGRLYVHSEGYVIEIRQVATDAVVLRLTRDKQNWPSGPLRLSPDGMRLVLMTRPPEGVVELWDTAKQTLIARLSNDPKQAWIVWCEFSPDGKLLATVDTRSRVYLWDASTGQLLRQVEPRPDTRYISIRFSGDGRLLATANEDAGVISVWDTATGSRVCDIELNKEKQNDFGVTEFSPDGSRLAFGVGGNAQVWDIQKGQLVFEFPISNKGAITALAFHPNGSLLAVGSYDPGSGVRLFDLNTGQERLRLQLDASVKQVAFTADGKHLITYDDGKVARTWDILTGQELFRFAHSGTTAEHIAYDAAKGRVATSNQAVAQVWDTASGRKIADFRLDDRVEGMALSPNGTRLAIHKHDSSDISVLKVDGGLATADVSAATLFTLHHEKAISAFAFSADGAMLATGSEDDVRLWDATSGKELARFNPQGRVKRVLLNDDNTVFAVSLEKENRGEVQFWQVPTRQKLAVAPFEGSDMAFRPGTATFAIANNTATVRIVQPERAKPEYGRLPLGKGLAETVISPDGQIIATQPYATDPPYESKEAEIWDIQTGKQLARVAHDMLPDIDFTADGRRLVTRDKNKTTHLWDTRTGRELLRLAQTGWPEFSTDGKRMVITRLRRSPDEEAQFELYDFDSGATIGKPIPIKKFINVIALSPDGRFLATGEGRIERKEENVGADLEVKMGFFGARLWDTHTGQEVVELPHKFPVDCVAFSPDGTLFATRTNPDPIRLWSAPAGKLVTELALPPESQVGWGCPKFSPDGRLLAADAGNELSIWRMTDYARVGLFMHKERVNSFAFSPDGRLLASRAGEEGLVWDLNLDPARAIVRLPEVKSFQFTPDGKRLIAVHTDNTVRVWQLDANDLIKDACSRLEGNLSHEAWRTYLGEEPYHIICPGLPVPER